MTKITQTTKNGITYSPELAIQEVRIRPPTYKNEYHGNGKNAWYGDTYTLTSETGRVIEVKRISIRHSYRWHRTAVRVNGCVPTAQTYKVLDALTV